MLAAVGQRVRELRRTHGMTHEELARGAELDAIEVLVGMDTFPGVGFTIIDRF